MARQFIYHMSGLSKAYSGGKKVLDNIHLSFYPDAKIGVLGPNGSGKSTMLRLAMGLLAPSRGRITWGGLEHVPPLKRAIVFQRPAMLRRSAAANLRFALRAAGIPRAEHARRIAELLELVGLHALTDRAARRLSGGEQQQLALAKALLLDPQVLCVDELSLGLAPVVVGELLEIVRRLHENGTTLVVVEQSLNIAAQLCDRAVFLEKGQVRFEGRITDLLERDDIARAVFYGGAVATNSANGRSGTRRKRPLSAAKTGQKSRRN